MKQFRLVDNVLGWLTFLIAAFVYCSTIEPTASFWDCPEFITTGYRLEVGHPPGAPFFMLTANLFSQFASDPSQVAYMVNMMSALLSATCILFLFWSITHLTRRLLINDAEYKSSTTLPLAKLIAIEAAGMVGALIYTFSDTFWFSAVEGEVYAYSSAFTAVVFWLILKWEDHADEPHADRWLVLIMYMTGLSIGVHLLNLLCLPAIVLVWYYKRYPNANAKGSLVALLVSFALVAVVLYGVVPGIITVGGWFELFFVNTLGMSFNTGLYIYILCLAAAVIWAIWETQHSPLPTSPDWRKSQMRQNIAFLLSVGLLGIPFYGYGWSAFIIGIVVLAVLWFVLNRQYLPVGETNRVALVSPRLKNTALLCMLMLMIGYSTYAVIVIRSDANPPMDQNSPEDIFTLGDYLGRDQYGQRPLFFGQAYTSQVALETEGNYCRPVMSTGKPVWQRKEKASADEKDSYFVVRTKDEYKYAQNMLFPRMYDAGHARDYESWMGEISCSEVPYDRCGEPMMVKMPSQFENLRFFLSYQCNWMYWRYFMWNFAGRQNDIQGHGELEHGNWLSGIPFIDNARLGDQSMLPDDLKENKGHNVFYCLPLLLGLIGLFWQSLKKGQVGIQQFWVVFFLFFMTGLAIVVYLNQTPVQPRERDYAYAGSFYAFAIWCGMGVAAIWETLLRLLPGGRRVNTSAAQQTTPLHHREGTGVGLSILVGIACLLVPIQMASQTWDDHDRSGRYTCRDFGQNYLMTLQDKGNPIIFTNGDNDTFPLWYNQDTEGVRTDARVCNLSYLQTDWYIDQMKRPAYDSPSVPISWERIEYCAGTNEYVQVDPSLKQQVLDVYREQPEEARKMWGDEPFELSNILKYWVRSTNKDFHVIPTDTVYMTIDKEAVRRSGMMLPSDSIPDRMVISLKGKSALYKGDLMMLEMIDQCNWERPIYVALTVGSDNYMNLGDNFVQEGLANRITPFTTKGTGLKNFDTEKTFNNVTKRYKYGNVSQQGIYLDETVMRMCYTHRRLLSQLAMNLVNEGQDEKAAKVLALAEKEIPSYNVPADFASGSLDMVRSYVAIGQNEQAKQLIDQLWKKSSQYMRWYCSLSPMRFANSQQECQMHLYILQMLAQLAGDVDEATGEKYEKQLEAVFRIFQSKGGDLGV